MQYLNLPDKIYFEVQSKIGQRADDIRSVETPKSFPCFVLNFNDDWNDYGYYDWFALFYFIDPNQYHFIGELKLMSSQEEDTIDLLKDGFYELDNSFCSLGNSIAYYNRIHETFGRQGATRVLNALRDCAMNVEVYEQFKDKGEFKTALLRDLSSSKALKEARFIVSGTSLENAFTFTYNICPFYNPKQLIEWNVLFKYKSQPYERYVGIIGENGTGKTTLLWSLTNDLVSKNKWSKFSKTPAFSSITVICSTPYDKYSIIKSDDYSIPYFWATTEQNESNTETVISKNIFHLINRNTLLDSESLIQILIDTVKEVAPNIEIGSFLYITKNEKQEFEEWYLDKENLSKAISIASSGERHIFTFLTELFANIFINSLFIIDEPEVHLHPKAIMQLMGVLGKVLKRFDSFAIIATHSPLIIREMISNNVFLIKRNEEDIMTIGSIDGQTFGEDISTLYQKTFEYNENNSLFTKTVKQLAKDGRTFEEIVSILNHSIGRLSLNATMTINEITLKFPNTSK